MGYCMHDHQRVISIDFIKYIMGSYLSDYYIINIFLNFSYVLWNVQDKLLPVIKKLCMEEDKKLTLKLFSLHEANITPDQLGVGEAFCCQTPSAVR